LNSLSFSEDNLSWLIIIDNSNLSFGILTSEFLTMVYAVKLAEEILIWLPVVIIENNYFKEFLLFTLGEYQFSVNSFVILTSLGFSIDGLYSY